MLCIQGIVSGLPRIPSLLRHTGIGTIEYGRLQIALHAVVTADIIPVNIQGDTGKLQSSFDQIASSYTQDICVYRGLQATLLPQWHGTLTTGC